MSHSSLRKEVVYVIINIIIIAVIAPPPPSNIMAYRINSTHFHVSWNLVQLELSHGFVDGYRIIYEGNTIQSVNVDASTNCVTIATMTPGIMYSIIVGAYNDIGETFSERVIIPGE